MTREDKFLSDVLAEVGRARAKFPGNKFQLAALHEESGELAMAMLDHEYGKAQPIEVYEEAVQVAAMALRVAIEGDSTMSYPGVA